MPYKFFAGAITASNFVTIYDITALSKLKKRLCI